MRFFIFIYNFLWEAMTGHGIQPHPAINHVSFRIGCSNCWKLSQIKMVFLKHTNKQSLCEYFIDYPWIKVCKSTSHIFIKVKNFVRSVVFFLKHFQIKVGPASNTLFSRSRSDWPFVNIHKRFLTKHSVANTYNWA